MCHGDVGNHEVFLAASRVHPESTLAEENLRTRIALVAALVARGRWLCGTPDWIETPGLMLGIAGIGYGLLRARFPGRVPSVLTLEPPRRSEHARHVA